MEYSHFNMILPNEVIKFLLSNNFETITKDNGVVEYRKNEISFYFVKKDMIIEFNPDGYFHVFQQISNFTLEAIKYFCFSDDLKRTELIQLFNHNNFISKIRNNYSVENGLAKPFTRKY